MRSVDAADLDGDGDPDAVLAARDVDQVSWYRNEPCPVSVPAAEIVRLGAPPNPAALLPGLSGPPRLGATWEPVIDHASFLPGALVDVLVLAAAPDNAPLPFGTLLCDLSTPPVLLNGAPGVPFALAIPDDACGLAGQSLCAQGASADASSIALTNALDVTVGTH